MEKITVFIPLLLLPISPHHVPGTLQPKLSPCTTIQPGQLPVAFKGSQGGSRRHQRVMPIPFFRLAFEDHGAVHVTCPFSIFCACV